MKCSTVRENLAGYMDDAIDGASQVRNRIQVREHLDGCAGCREDLERFRKLSALLSRVPRSLPPVDLATRIRVAAAQSPDRENAPSTWRRMRDRAEILLDNVFRPITLPATGGFASAILVFVVCFMILSGLQIIVSSKPDSRKIFVVGIPLCFGLSLDILPVLYTHVGPWLRPLFESSLTLTVVLAVILNRLLAFGIRPSDPPVAEG